jgi:DNA-binding transcriptional regulator/RsmH inhibitor MraZ
MTLPIDNKPIEMGFCTGIYDVTVDVGPRIRLPRTVLRVLVDHDVKDVWIYPDPTGRRLIICPDPNRPDYVRAARRNLPKFLAAGRAEREFICSARNVVLADHGRLSVASFAPTGFHAAATDLLVIVGTGLWYEVWRQEDWSAYLAETDERKRT